MFGLFRKLRRPTHACQVCNRRYDLPFDVVFRGRTLTAQRSARCPACSTRYLDQVAGTCGKCKGPIVPGEPVATHFGGGPELYAHYTLECSVVGSCCVGTWPPEKA